MTDSDSDLGRLQVIDLDAGEVFSGQASGRLITGFAAPVPIHLPSIQTTCSTTPCGNWWCGS